MKLKPIVTSLLEQDLYKYSMGQAIFHQFAKQMTTWTFKCRNVGVHFTPEMVQEIKEQIQHYCSLRYKEDELNFLSSILWIQQDYIDICLRNWHPRYEEFTIDTNSPCGLNIETSGTWLNTSQYEMPVLMIINEVYFRMSYNYKALYESFVERLMDKYNMLKDGRLYVSSFSGFGLRRRLSGEAEEKFVDVFSHLNDRMCASKFIGLSNVYLAYKYEKMPTGTMAHEWIMGAGQGDMKHNPAYCNWYALNAWVKEYGTLNGTALTDTIGTDVFLMDFQLTFSKLFSGVRHDSGDPIAWGEKMIRHYDNFGIDPKTKMLLFSDSLNFKKADEIFRHFQGRANVAFGIGTYLTNDTFAEPLNIVMKMTKCNGHDVAKLSDCEGKGMCKNPEYIAFLQTCIKQRMNCA